VITGIAVLFLEHEVECEGVLALETSEIALVQLLKLSALFSSHEMAATSGWKSGILWGGGAGAKLGERFTNLIQSKDHLASLLDLNEEFSIEIARHPTNIDARPLLNDGPLLVKEPSAVEEEEGLKHILI